MDSYFWYVCACALVSLLASCVFLSLSFVSLRFALFCFPFMSFVLVHLPPHGGLLIGGPGNGAPPPSKSSPYAIIYNPRAETKCTSKVYDAAPLNDRLGELILAVIFIIDQ